LKPDTQEIELIEIFDSIAVDASRKQQRKEELRNKQKRK